MIYGALIFPSIEFVVGAADTNSKAQDEGGFR
jgi:hypothetical protein